MLRRTRIRLSRTATVIAAATGRLLYRPDDRQRTDPFGIPAEYSRIFFPAMHLLWAIAICFTIAETKWLTGPNPATASHAMPWATRFADGIVRFGALAFGLTLLLIPVTIIAVKTGRQLMTFTQRINEWILPKDIRQEINDGVAAGIAAKVDETRQELNAKWQSWIDRRDAAFSKGEDFHEPPPSALA